MVTAVVNSWDRALLGYNALAAFSKFLNRVTPFYPPPDLDSLFLRMKAVRLA